MEPTKQPSVISDVAKPSQNSQTRANPEAGGPPPQNNPTTQATEAPLDTRTQAPVVASKDNSNLKTTILIVVAVIVALLLIAGAYMAFMQQEVGAPAEAEYTPQQQTSTEADTVDAATLDQDMAEVDAAINELDESTEFSEDEINDSNLGL